MNIKSDVSGKRRAVVSIAASVIALAAISCGPVDDDSVPEQDAIGSVQQALDPQKILVGAKTQRDFQNAWREQRPHEYTSTNNFVSKMGNSDTVSFYKDMGGGTKFFMESGGDGTAGDGADTVDLLWLTDHAGNTASTARFTTWWDPAVNPGQERFFSKDMSLGDSARGLRALLIEACDVFPTDGSAWTRWGNAFRGGLIVAATHREKASMTNCYGGKTADNINAGQPLGDAFANAALACDSSSKPVTVATADNATNCWPRIGVKKSGLLSAGRFQGNNIGFMCWVTYN